VLKLASRTSGLAADVSQQVQTASAMKLSELRGAPHVQVTVKLCSKGESVSPPHAHPHMKLFAV